MTTIVTRNKQNQERFLVLESVSLSHNNFISILKEHVWLEELSFKHVNITQLDERKIQLHGNSLNRLAQLQIASCELGHIPSYVLEPVASSSSTSNAKQMDLIHHMKRHSITAQRAMVDMYASCLQHTLITLDLSDNHISELPSSIVQLVSLQTLILSMNHFTKFPKHVTKIRTLTSLHLKCNKISKIEDGLFQPLSIKSLFSSSKKKSMSPICRSLKTLILGHNCLQSFPDALSNLSILQELDLSHNQNIKDSIEKDGSLFGWKNTLQMLNLDNCGLETFPSLVSKLPNLRHIHMSHNNFNIIPKLGNLPYLSTLTITSCGIEDLSPIFPQKMLRKLNASHNCIRKVPALSIHSLNVLEELLLSNNEIGELGQELRAYTALVTLDCGHNKITNVDSCISTLGNVKYLNLSHNNIASLPDDIFADMRNLRSINLSHNKNLEKLPSLTNCKHLQRLFAKCCSLKSFPSGLDELKSLLELDLSHNLLPDIHTSIYGCELLEILDISCNAIDTLEPKNDMVVTNGDENHDEKRDISNLYSLRKLKIDGNNISEFPTSIVALEDVDTIRMSFRKPLSEEQLNWINMNSITVFNTFFMPKKVHNFLFIGTKDSISNIAVLRRELGITHILNLCSRKVAYQMDTFQLMSKYEVLDEKDNFIKITDFLNDCCTFIKTAVKSNDENRCLIICDDCQFLSPLIAMAYELRKASNGSSPVVAEQLVQQFQDQVQDLKLTQSIKSKMESLLRIYSEHMHPAPSSPVLVPTQSPTEVNLQSFAGLLSKKVPFIKTLLTNDRNRAYFKQFCEQERSIENVSFWEEVELRYKKIQDGLQRYGYARKIFETFIDAYEAPYQLNIDQRLVDEIESQLDAFSHLDPYVEGEEENTDSDDKDRWRMSLVFPSHTFFDSLVVACERLMLDTVQRFQKSELFSLMQTDELKKGTDVKFLIQTPPSSFRSLTGL